MDGMAKDGGALGYESHGAFAVVPSLVVVVATSCKGDGIGDCGTVE